jgi:hypothetical protein
MGKSVVVAVVLMLLLLGAALVAYRTLLGDDRITKVLPTIVDAGPRELVDGAGAGGVLDAGAPLDLRAEITQARGSVQVRPANGAWGDAAVGTRLNADDGVKTGRNAEAVLRMGDGVEVRLSPRSEFTVRELSAQVSKIRLEEGHVTATVDEKGARSLKVAAKGTDAEAESAGGQFGVVTDGKGQLAVATATGKVKLTSAGQTVEVVAGEASTASAGEAPSAPRAIPNSLFLKVGAGAAKTNQLATTVSGTTDPGAVVRVNDAMTAADENGKFTMKVPLKDGKNKLAVEVTDASGRTKSDVLPDVTVDREKPKIEAETKWGTP